jgi:hypothetical protein
MGRARLPPSLACQDKGKSDAADPEGDNRAGGKFPGHVWSYRAGRSFENQAPANTAPALIKPNTTSAAASA